MSDLRTRIIAVLYDCGEMPAAKAARLADAVIRELGLKRASRPSDYGHVNYPPGYQYITDWIAND